VLLVYDGADANTAARNGLTPLHVSTHYGHNDVSRLLLIHGADPSRTAQVKISVQNIGLFMMHAFELILFEH